MTSGLATGLYLASAILFIRSLGGLSSQESARRGNLYGMIGMALAIVTTAWTQKAGLEFSIAAIAAGALVGSLLARRVGMTTMPELVAILHSFVGAGAVLVGLAAGFTAPHGGPGHAGVATATVDPIHGVETFVGILVGAVTFTGSIVAWGKLRGTFTSRPVLLPGRHLINAGILVASLALLVPYLQSPAGGGHVYLLAVTGLAALLGVHLVFAIGGADMPVVVSLLNSYSGWAAAAAGFLLENDLLIVTGALVGSSGAILSIIMCRAMNRSIWNVVFGGFGADDGKAPAAGAEAPQGEIKEIDAAAVATALAEAKQVVVVPGYGMAVSQAQGALYEIAMLLKKRGITMRFAIHPVAGRLPGHMNVLLAEARVPYDIVLEMDEINHELPDVDVVLVVGANDIVNPGAQTDTTSPIYGMPVLEVWKSKLTVVTKRGMAKGYAGIENPLFYLDGTRMLFGDAKKTMDAVLARLKSD